METANVTDLVVLMGTNPLPNYVVAKYFLKVGELRTVWIVYTKETDLQKDNLIKLLRDEHREPVKLIAVFLTSESDAQRIREDITKQLLDNLSGGNVAFNYTGGTQAMGIHVYRTLEKHLGNRCSFSYLSASKFWLIDDEAGVISGDLRKEIPISLEDLIRLHAFDSKKEPEIDFIKATQVFARIVREDKLDELWRGGYETDLYKNELFRSPDIFEEKKSAFSSEEFKSILTSLPAVNEDTLRNIKRYLDGLWLEDYVHNILRNAFEDTHTVDKNWKVTKREWIDNDFEIDVLMLIGYQLLGCSCSTRGYLKKKGDKEKLKNKGFEIILRTRQIGGDEAKAVLITLAEKSLTSTLENELRIETGSTANIIVLGKNDLPESRFVRKIIDLINLT